MAYTLPNEPSPSGAVSNALNIYNMLRQLGLAKQQGQRAEAQNKRQEEMQPYNIKHLLAQTQGLEGANTRANQMLTPQLQALKDAHAAAVRKADPNYEINQFMRTMDALGKMGQGGTNNPPPNNEPNYNALREKMTGKPAMGEGQGMFPVAEEDMTEQQELPEKPKLDLKNLNDYQKAFLAQSKYKGLLGDATRPYQGPARNALDLERLKKEVSSGRIAPEVYQNAKAEYDAQLEAKKDLRDLRARTKAGLKVGEKEFFDPDTGVPLGKEVPLTAKERDSEEGNILFNELYPYVYKGASPFSGEGSIDRLEQAAANYKTDPKAKKLFDDFLLSEKMLAATAVNEASTLKAGKTNQTFNVLKDTLAANDVPNIVKKFIKQYQIPASAQLKASMEYQKKLSDARKKARTSTPAMQKFYYNPEMQAQHDMVKNEKTAGNDLSQMSDEELRAIAGGQ